MSKTQNFGRAKTQRCIICNQHSINGRASLYVLLKNASADAEYLSKYRGLAKRGRGAILNERECMEMMFSAAPSEEYTMKQWEEASKVAHTLKQEDGTVYFEGDNVHFDETLKTLDMVTY